MGIEQRPNVIPAMQQRAGETITGFKIENPDGSTTYIREFKDNKNAYQIWGKFKGGANEFFQEAEELTKRLGVQVAAEPRKPFQNNFYFGFYGNEGIEMTLEDFAPQDSLSNLDNLALARFDGKFGMYSIERFDKERELDVVFSTHLDAPEEVAELFTKYSQGQVDKEALVDVLKEIKK